MKNLLLLLLLCLSLFGDELSCEHKLRDAKVYDGKTIKIPLENSLLLVYSKSVPDEKILRFDISKNLYILEAKSQFKYPFRVANGDEKLSKHLFSDDLGVIFSDCCLLHSLITPDGEVGLSFLKEFIIHEQTKNTHSYFAEYKGIYFDDGLRVVKISADVKPKGLKLGDLLFEANHHKITGKREFLQALTRGDLDGDLLFIRDSFQFFVKLD